MKQLVLGTDKDGPTVVLEEGRISVRRGWLPSWEDRITGTAMLLFFTLLTAGQVALLVWLGKAGLEKPSWGIWGLWAGFAVFWSVGPIGAFVLQWKLLPFSAEVDARRRRYEARCGLVPVRVDLSRGFVFELEPYTSRGDWHYGLWLRRPGGKIRWTVVEGVFAGNKRKACREAERLEEAIRSEWPAAEIVWRKRNRWGKAAETAAAETEAAGGGQDLQD